ncbi:MAG: Fur family transcriptional regulator [Campylobacterota bacterium]|nr:Fur family transcriptional regulator [Campylobacterota bacterium]
MNDNQVKDELKQKGIKNTRAKSALLQILKNNSAPMDVNTLHKECQKMTSVNLVTVYRTLQQFHEKRLVQEFLDKDSVTQYEYISLESRAHPHFQCQTCNKVFCLGELSFEDALYFSNMASKHKVNTINITLNGVCAECQ